MDERLRKLEQDMAVVKETMATRESLLATREDIQKTINSQTWKIITAMGVFSSILTGLCAAIVHSMGG